VQACSGGGACPAHGKLPGDVVAVQEVEERNQMWQPDPAMLAFLETVHCQLCGADDNEERLLLCDGELRLVCCCLQDCFNVVACAPSTFTFCHHSHGPHPPPPSPPPPPPPQQQQQQHSGCDRGYHTDCLGLDGIPEGEWFCPQCEQERAMRRQRARQQAAAPVRRERSRSQPRAGPTAAATRPQRTWQQQGEDGSSVIVISDSDSDSDDEPLAVRLARVTEAARHNRRGRQQQQQQQAAHPRRQRRHAGSDDEYVAGDEDTDEGEVAEMEFESGGSGGSSSEEEAASDVTEVSSGQLSEHSEGDAGVGDDDDEEDEEVEYAPPGVGSMRRGRAAATSSQQQQERRVRPRTQPRAAVAPTARRRRAARRTRTQSAVPSTSIPAAAAVRRTPGAQAPTSVAAAAQQARTAPTPTTPPATAAGASAAQQVRRPFSVGQLLRELQERSAPPGETAASGGVRIATPEMQRAAEERMERFRAHQAALCGPGRYGGAAAGRLPQRTSAAVAQQVRVFEGGVGGWWVVVPPYCREQQQLGHCLRDCRLIFSYPPYSRLPLTITLHTMCYTLPPPPQHPHTKQAEEHRRLWDRLQRQEEEYERSRGRGSQSPQRPQQQPRRPSPAFTGGSDSGNGRGLRRLRRMDTVRAAAQAAPPAAPPVAWVSNKPDATADAIRDSITAARDRGAARRHGSQEARRKPPSARVRRVGPSSAAGGTAAAAAAAASAKRVAGSPGGSGPGSPLNGTSSSGNVGSGYSPPPFAAAAAVGEHNLSPQEQQHRRLQQQQRMQQQQQQQQQRLQQQQQRLQQQQQQPSSQPLGRPPMRSQAPPPARQHQQLSAGRAPHWAPSCGHPHAAPPPAAAAAAAAAAPPPPAAAVHYPNPFRMFEFSSSQQRNAAPQSAVVRHAATPPSVGAPQVAGVGVVPSAHTYHHHPVQHPVQQSLNPTMYQQPHQQYHHHEQQQQQQQHQQDCRYQQQPPVAAPSLPPSQRIIGNLQSQSLEAEQLHHTRHQHQHPHPSAPAAAAVHGPKPPPLSMDDLRSAKAAAFELAKRAARAVPGGEASICQDREAMRTLTHSLYERVKRGVTQLETLLEAACGGGATKAARAVGEFAATEAQRLMGSRM